MTLIAGLALGMLLRLQVAGGAVLSVAVRLRLLLALELGFRMAHRLARGRAAHAEVEPVRGEEVRVGERLLARVGGRDAYADRLAVRQLAGGGEVIDYINKVLTPHMPKKREVMIIDRKLCNRLVASKKAEDEKADKAKKDAADKAALDF